MAAASSATTAANFMSAVEEIVFGDSLDLRFLINWCGERRAKVGIERTSQEPTASVGLRRGLMSEVQILPLSARSHLLIYQVPSAATYGRCRSPRIDVRPGVPSVRHQGG